MIWKLTAVNAALHRIGHPVEDACAADDCSGALVVADGITRQPLLDTPSTRTWWGKLRLISRYPRDRNARLASEACCRAFIAQIRRAGPGAQLRDAIEAANQAIETLNQRVNPRPDYLVNDYLACTAAFALDHKASGTLEYAFVFDCVVALLDHDARLKFRTYPEHTEQVSAAFRRLTGGLENTREFNAPAQRWLRRAMLRNNPGCSASYGVLTGESEAMHYVRSGRVERASSDIVILISDGLEEIAFDNNGVTPAFRTALLRSIEIHDPQPLLALCQRRVRSEGTLVMST